MRTWWLLLLACCLLPAAAAGTLTAWGVLSGQAQLRVSELRTLQMGKLNDPTHAMEFVFVGDSSLGNAIDAATWERLSGRPTANLALTGAFGLAGSYNMIRRAVRAHGTRYVVIMQAADMMARDVSYQGFALTFSARDWYQVSPVDLVASFLNWTLLEQSLEGLLGTADRPEAVTGDYIAQGPHAAPEDIVAEPLTPSSINPRQEYFLRKIAEYCDGAGVTCIYAHGPVYEGTCIAAAGYLTEVNARIGAAGLTLAEGTPLCMPADDVGDGTDHVRPELKQAYTERLFGLIAPLAFGTARAVRRD